MAWNLSSIFELTNARAQAVAVVDTTGTQLSSLAGNPPANAALTTVPYAAGSQAVLAANVNRRKFIISNPTNKTVFVAFAATASLTSYSVVVPQNSVYASELGDYTGAVSAIWQSAPVAGPELHVTEITV